MATYKVKIVPEIGIHVNLRIQVDLRIKYIFFDQVQCIKQAETICFCHVSLSPTGEIAAVYKKDCYLSNICDVFSIPKFKTHCLNHKPDFHRRLWQISIE